MRPGSSLLLERRVCWMRVLDRAYSTTPLLLAQDEQPSNADPIESHATSTSRRSCAVHSLDSMLTI